MSLLRSIAAHADRLRGRRVFLRIDANVPMRSGRVHDDMRIRHVLPTMRMVIDNGGTLVLASHRGRPKACFDDGLTMAPIAQAIGRHLGRDVRVIRHDGDDAGLMSADSEPVKMLENLRFYPGEESNDPDFARALSRVADIYVNDAFSCCHRAHASIVGIPRYLDSFAGHGLVNEVETLARFWQKRRRPCCAIIGGSKISSKLGLLTHLLPQVDHLIIVGAMANTFIFAKGGNIGSSLCEESMRAQALDILARAKQKGTAVLIAGDAVVTSRLTADAPRHITDSQEVEKGMMIVDIGPQSRRAIASVIGQCRTALWNGPAGVFECAPFADGSIRICDDLALASRKNGLISIAGGGDTAAVIARSGKGDDFSHISTGGGAFLAWLEGRELPGIKALRDGRHGLNDGKMD